MKITRHKILDWETVLIRFVPAQKRGDWAKEALSLAERWSANRARLTGNARGTEIPLEYGIVSAEPDGAVTVMMGWFSPEILPPFEKFLRRYAKGFKSIEIGWLPSVDREEIDTENIEFVSVPEKEVKFEDGTIKTVAPFQISRYPVTFAHFQRFVEATGYVTTNEQHREAWTYRENDHLPPAGDPSRATTPVTCVSYRDALAYCEWANLRLPTEAEWLAAYVWDWNVYSYEDAYAAEDRETARPEAMKAPGPEWTAEYDPGSDQAIVRGAPQYILEQDWAETVNRRGYPAEHTDLALQFRVCKL